MSYNLFDLMPLIVEVVVTIIIFAVVLYTGIRIFVIFKNKIQSWIGKNKKKNNELRSKDCEMDSGT